MKGYAHMRKILSIILCFILFLSSVQVVLAKISFLDDYDAIENALNSVLYIETDDDYDDVYFTSGSGFVAFDSKTFVTNYHVIEGAVSISVYDEDYREYKVGEILAVDKERDIAIISFKSSTTLVPLTLADNPEIKRGQPVATIGYPKGLFSTFSTGIISAILDFDDRREIQFTAPISHGSSGGVLLNDNGEVIGITTSLIEDGQNINFAVDISHVIALYRQQNPNYLPGWSTATNLPNSTPKLTNTPKPTEKIILNPPQDLKATLTFNSVILTWSPVESASNYIVYRSSAKNGPYFYAAETQKTTHEDKNIVNEKKYYYKVSSESFSLESEKSQYVEVTIPPPTPKPTPSPSPAPISYITSEEIAKYKTLQAGMNGQDVARLKERMFELGYFNNMTVNNSYTISTAKYVEEFQQANGLEINGIATPEMQALFFSKYAIPKPTPSPKHSPSPSPIPRLSKPTNVKASISGTTITLSWTAVKDATEYNVYTAMQPTDVYSLFATVTTNLFVDRNTTSNFTYYYKIESVSGHNVSEQSTVVKAVTQKPTPTPYIEPEYPIQIGSDGYSGTPGNPYINPKIVNISKTRTVDGFTLTYKCLDVYENILKHNGTSIYSEYTYTKTIKPGKSTYPGEVSLTRDGNVKYIYVAITKIHTADRKTYNIPEEDWNFFYWTLD